MGSQRQQQTANDVFTAKAQRRKEQQEKCFPLRLRDFAVKKQFAVRSVAALVALLVCQVAWAGPSAPPSGYDTVIKAANSAYNAGDYKTAVDGYVQAIQQRPSKPVPYRNLARAYFWQSNYAEAVVHYDNYLHLATDAKDRPQVQSERRLAASRAGGTGWTMPEAQRRALDMLQDKLDNGVAYAHGAGGAWGVYQTLLRTGYAQPDLARLQRVLVKKLLDEYEGLLVPDSGQPMPRLDLQQWQDELARLDAIRHLSDDEAMLGIVGRRQKVADTAVALLNSRYEEAAKLAATAIEQNPDMAFVRWLQVDALVKLEHYKKALAAVDDLAKKLAAANPGQLAYAKIMRANILQRMGRGADAAGLYLGLIDK